MSQFIAVSLCNPSRYLVRQGRHGWRFGFSPAKPAIFSGTRAELLEAELYVGSKLSFEPAPTMAGKVAYVSRGKRRLADD